MANSNEQLDVSMESIDSDTAEFLNATNDIITGFLESETVVKSRSCWVHQVNRNRSVLGEHATIYENYRKFPEKFKEYYRLYPNEFDELFSLISPLITGPVESGQGAVGGRADSMKAVEKLALTLRYLAHGGSLTILAKSYHLGFATVHKHVRSTCKAIVEALLSEFIRLPNEVQWKQIAQGFLDRWDFANCIGSIDGKHIVMQKPDKSHAMFINYKGTFSIVLLAVTDSKYRFIHIDVGEYGKSSDGGTFSSSQFGQALKSETLNIPKDKPLPDTNEPFPYVFVADEAFPLQNHIMRPFGGASLPLKQQVFNYRLSRARHVVENSFGILVNRWRVLKNRLELQPDHAIDVVQACCILHNFVIDKRGTHTTEVDTVLSDGSIIRNGTWRQDPQLKSVRTDYGSNNYTKNAKNVREKLVDYFNSDKGMVDYQIEQTKKHY